MFLCLVLLVVAVLLACPLPAPANPILVLDSGSITSDLGFISGAGTFGLQGPRLSINALADTSSFGFRPAAVFQALAPLEVPSMSIFRWSEAIGDRASSANT
jgi:hypothetical protein